MDRDGISVYVAKDMDKDGFKNLTNTDPTYIKNNLKINATTF